jgi:hypothetical protein
LIFRVTPAGFTNTCYIFSLLEITPLLFIYFFTFLPSIFYNYRWVIPIYLLLYYLFWFWERNCRAFSNCDRSNLKVSLLFSFFILTCRSSWSLINVNYLWYSSSRNNYLNIVSSAVLDLIRYQLNAALVW